MRSFFSLFLAYFSFAFLFFFWLKFYAVHFFCVDNLKFSCTARVRSCRYHSYQVCVLISLGVAICLQFCISNNKTKEKNEKKPNKSRGLFKTNHGKIFFSLWLLNLRKQDFIWIGLDGSHPSMLDVAFTAFLLYWFYFWCWLFDLSFTALKCHAFTLAHIVWWGSYDYLIWSVVQRVFHFDPVYQVFKYCINIKCRHQHNSGWFFIYNIQLNFVSSSQLSSTRLDSTSLQFSNNNF